MHIDPHFDTAEEVANFLLQETGRGLIDNDVDAFIRRFRLPLPVGTFDGQQILNRPEELLDVLRKVRQYLEFNNIDLVVRHNVQASFVSPSQISTTHESRYLCRGQQVGHPTACHSTLERIDGTWQITSNDYAVSDAPELNRALLNLPLQDPADVMAHPQKPQLRVSTQDLSEGTKS